MRKPSGYGKVLRHLRKLRRLRQGEIADRIGVDQSQIPKWELERMGMRFDSLVEFLDALDTGMEDFGRLFDRSRRGEPLVDPESEDELTRDEEQRRQEAEIPVRKGRAAVFLWEEEDEGVIAQLAPEAQRELDAALTELRYALDQLRPPEERPRPDEERELTNGNGEDKEE